MSQDLIKRYKKSIRVRFQSNEMEDKYRGNEEPSGSDSSVFSFSILCIINLIFAYLEYRALGVKESMIPMYCFIVTALAALGNALTSQFGKQPYFQDLRLLLNGTISMLVVMLAIVLHTFSPYYIAELAIFILWMGALNAIRFITTSIINVSAIVLFLLALNFAKTAISSFWMINITLILVSSAMLSGYLSYVLERQRRILFLQNIISTDMNSRQEAWAYTLIDLDMALSGILDFREMIDLLKKYLEPVIRFDSYVLTSLEGKGPKPVADRIEGELFENEDRTIWSQDLLDKLAQTRQPTTSAEHEMVKGFLGIERKRFTSHRMDIPVFRDSNLLGVISLRRADESFDDLDMIAGMSLATQAMLIYKRTRINLEKVQKSAIRERPDPERSMPDPVVRVPRQADKAAKSNVAKKPRTIVEKMASTMNTDFHITDDIRSIDQDDSTGIDEMVAPSDLVKRIREEEETTKKTITLLSRENADKIAMDKYRSAAVEGEPLSILIIEVDGLSKLREQDGDQVAYKVFAAIVKYIFSNVDKSNDILGRYGQNGLSVLMPGIDMNAAEKFAEKVRQFVERARYKTAYGEKSATLSIGVAAITDDTGDYGSMVKRADMALFVAKKNGRNCVKVRL
ncbi:MAG: diguanylate cyclase [Gammaproteobacteria bacterium]|nr:diguanylate cyclase [Gammaproteobacteria bacterium]